MERTGFVFLPSYLEAVEKVPEAYRAEALMAICRFGITGEEPEESSAYTQIILSLIRNSITHGKGKYQASRENGAKGGRPKKKPEEIFEKTQLKTQENQDIDIDKDKDKDIDREKEKDTDREKETETGSVSSSCVFPCFKYF